MSDSESSPIPNMRRKLEGHTDPFTSSTPTDHDDGPRRKHVTHMSQTQHEPDPKLVHHLDGHQIIRHGHTPFASGGFCDIFTGDHKMYGKVAMRRPRMTEKGYTWGEMSNFLAESAIWKKLSHPNILQFLGLIQSDGYIWAVSRFAANGALPAYLKARPEANRRALVLQLADAIGYLHLQGVIHGDIKGSNVLVSATDTTLLCDFGLSKPSGSLTRTSLSGATSVRWCAPELLFDDEATKTCASDVYSFGMTVYEILSGNVPLHDIASEFLAVTAINDGSRPPREPAASESGDSYEQLWDISSASWDSDPSNRPSMEVICDRLGVTITLPLRTSKENSGVVDDVMVNIMDGEQARQGTDDHDERTADVVRVVRGNSPQIVGITDDEIIQKIPRAKAQYNSSLRRGARRCLQDTRVGLLETLHDWIDGTGPHKEPIFWLSGEAGTGKSTIAHTIAEDRNTTRQLGASFFFSRNDETRRDANLFISTLAYQLSIFDEGFKAQLAASLRDDPTLPDQSIKDQLKDMVMEPLKKTKTLGGKTIFIVVDALDECDPDAGAEEILEAWAELVQGFPLRLLITSRPSWHIQAKFSSSRHLSAVFHLHDISKTVVKSDVEHYLRVSLVGVLEGGLADDDLDCLSQRIGMLFILASTYTKYIKDPIRKNPSGQLRALLSRTPTLGRSPEGELNALYLDIVQGVPEDSDTADVIDAFQKVVGAMVVSSIPMTPIQLSDLLEMDEGDVLYVLRRLSSVIFLADDSDPVSFFHQSFPEFLTNPKRCADPRYVVNKSEAHSRMALSCFDVLDKDLPRDPLSTPWNGGPSVSYNSQSSEGPNALDTTAIAAQDSEIPEAVSLSTSKAYPENLCYACVYLSYHLHGIVQENPVNRTCLGRFEAFYSRKRAQWLDVITSLEDIPGLSDLPARLHSGYIKYYLSHGVPSRRTLNQMLSFQRGLQPHTAKHINQMIPDETIDRPPAVTAAVPYGGGFTSPSIVQAKAAFHPRFSFLPEQHYPYPPATSTRPSPSYPYDVPASTRQSIPSQTPYATSAYSGSPMGAFAPPTSAPHASLGPPPIPRYSSDYTNILADQAQSTASHAPSPSERSSRQSHSLTDEDYSSPLPGGLRHGPGAASQDYDITHLLLSTDSFAIPPISDVIPRPSRATRSSHGTAPYATPDGGSGGRVESSVRYLDGRPPTPPLSTIDTLQGSSRRSTRSNKSVAASDIPLEKSFVCETCDARFARNHDLTRHRKVHNPVEQHRCKGCGRSFSTKDALERHATTKNCGNDN